MTNFPLDGISNFVMECLSQRLQTTQETNVFSSPEFLRFSLIFCCCVKVLWVYLSMNISMTSHLYMFNAHKHSYSENQKGELSKPKTAIKVVEHDVTAKLLLRAAPLLLFWFIHSVHPFIRSFVHSFVMSKYSVLSMTCLTVSVRVFLWVFHSPTKF